MRLEQPKRVVGMAIVLGAMEVSPRPSLGSSQPISWPTPAGSCPLSALHLRIQDQIRDGVWHWDDGGGQKEPPNLAMRFEQFSFGDFCRFCSESFLLSLVGRLACQRCSLTVLRIFNSIWDGLYIERGCVVIVYEIMSCLVHCFQKNSIEGNPVRRGKNLEPSRTEKQL